MKVKNINGTSEHNVKCKCGSWIEHWKNFSNAKLGDYCYEKSCTKKPEFGAHVQKVESNDNDWYIIPFCPGHNNVRDEEIELIAGAPLAPANRQKTCEK